MTLETIFVAVGRTDEDRLDAIADITTDIAGPTGATVVLAHVFEPDEYSRLRSQLDFDRDSEATPDAVAKRHVVIRQLGEAMGTHDVEFTWQGSLADEDAKGERIVELAEEVDAGLLVVGGRKRSPAGKAIFGSTAQEIMLESPCPVTFVRGD